MVTCAFSTQDAALVFSLFLMITNTIRQLKDQMQDVVTSSAEPC